METLLIHKNYDGEPMGVWNEKGQSVYVPGQDTFKKKGQRRMDSRGWSIPWADFVERAAETVNHHSWWDRMTTSASLDAALEVARNKYFSSQNEEVALDR